MVQNYDSKLFTQDETEHLRSSFERGDNMFKTRLKMYPSFALADKYEKVWYGFDTSFSGLLWGHFCIISISTG